MAIIEKKNGQPVPPVEQWVIQHEGTHEVLGPGGRKDVFVWELPVRLTHWINVTAILILSITGYYISNPFIGTRGDAVNQFLMGLNRFIHFSTAFVFTASVLFRVYWMFTGNRWASWKQWLATSRARRRSIPRMICYYITMRCPPPAMIGHNPLAGSTYSVVYLLFFVQILTGFGLYSLAFSGGFWPAVFGWLPLMFGIPVLRVIHDVITFLVIAFTIHHVYSAVLIDIEERSGLMSSIVTGFKTFSEEYVEAAEELENDNDKNSPHPRWWGLFGPGKPVRPRHD